MLLNTAYDAVITDVERAHMAKYIRRTISEISKRNFPIDPLVVQDVSLATSKVSSAYKRHGYVLEEALRTALNTRADLDAWTVELRVPQRKKKMQVDLLTYQAATRTLSAYEIKRSFVNLDDQARDRVEERLTDLLSALPAHANCRKISAADYRVAVVGYYDCVSRPVGPHKLIASPDLPAEFGPGTVAFVGDVNDYYSHCLLRRQVPHLLRGLQQIAELPAFRDAPSPQTSMVAAFSGLASAWHPWDALA